MAELAEIRIGVVGLEPEAFSRCCRAFAEDGSHGIALTAGADSLRWELRKPPHALALNFVPLGPLTQFSKQDPAVLAELEALIVRLTCAEETGPLEELVLHLPSPPEAFRSRIGLIALTPALDDAAAWMDQARADTLPLLGRKLRFYRIATDQDFLGPTLSWVLEIREERDFEALGEWLDEQPRFSRRVLERIDAFIDAHPDGLYAAQLRSEKEQRLTRRRSRLMRVPLALLATAMVTLLCWSGCARSRDSRLFEHARQFEGDSPARQWLAIDAYRSYLAGTSWVSSAERTSRAKARIAELSLALIEQPHPAPQELERYLALIERHPDGAGVRLDPHRQRLRELIAVREFDRYFAQFSREGAKLKPLEAVWHSYLASPQADPQAARIKARYAGLLTRRAREQDAALWREIQSEARRFQQPAPRMAIYQRYLARSLRHDHDARARAAIVQEQLRIDDQLWQAIKLELRNSKQPAAARIKIVDRFLAAHPNNSNLTTARQTRRALLLLFDKQDWTVVLSRSKALGNKYPQRIALLFEHQQALLDHRCSHEKRLIDRVKGLRKSADHHRYQQLKRWYEREPDAAPRIAAAFELYLREFPKGAHAGPARQFIRWWERVNRTASYTIKLIGARINKKKVSTGETTPEPYLELSSGGQKLTTKPSSSYNPSWNRTFILRWKPGQVLMLRIYEKDIRFDDYLFTIKLHGLLSLAKLTGTLRHVDGHQIQVQSNFPLPKLP